MKTAYISACAKRLPRYFRCLRECLVNGEVKISSTDLASRLGTTPSQVRADLNGFSGIGTQGYGYNVKLLYTEISRKLGVADGMTAVVIGAHERNIPYLPLWLEGRGVSLSGGIPVTESLYGAVSALDCDIAIVIDCPDREKMQNALKASRVRGVWNMTQGDLELDIPVLNLPIGDIILSLMYEIKQNDKGEKQ